MAFLSGPSSQAETVMEGNQSPTSSVGGWIAGGGNGRGKDQEAGGSLASLRATPGDMFGCGSWGLGGGANGSWWVEARDAVQHPASASRHHRELSAVLGFKGELKEWVRPEGKEMGEARWPGSDHGGSGGSFCWMS